MMMECNELELTLNLHWGNGAHTFELENDWSERSRKYLYFMVLNPQN